MSMPNLWIIVFFFTMILLGIDTQFALVETFCYFIEDLSAKFRRKHLDPQLVRGSICFLTFVIGLPVCTQGGMYVIGMMDTFLYAIPASVTNLLQVLVWVKVTDFDYGVNKLMIQTNEVEPPTDMFALKTTSIWVCGTMLVICIYVTISDGIVAETFSPRFATVGTLLVLLMLFPIIYYYIFNRGTFGSCRRIGQPQPLLGRDGQPSAGETGRATRGGPQGKRGRPVRAEEGLHILTIRV